VTKMDAADLIQKGRIKRYFRARRKLDCPHFISHITQRAAGKEPLFVEERDYLSMLGLLKDISRNYSLGMYAFCLMPNHVHLLLRPEDENLYDAMRDLFSQYAMRFNRKYERKGHLFGGPYRQAVCLDDSYLLATSLYIHLNPVRAGLVREATAYRWSSSNLYCQNGVTRSFVDPDFVLGLLPDNGSERNARYRRLLIRGSRLEAGHVLEQEDAVEVFRSKLSAVFHPLFKWVDRQKQTAKPLGADITNVEDLERQIEQLRTSPFPNNPVTRRAKKYLIEQLVARGYKRSEIAHKLGISRKTVYNLLRSSI